ncbi:MAG TPA: serine hydrolase domain-containing protein [Micromonosporaceae bacterium]|nr:serine hydrolase domain-containing protein [Micromonosporaceae bacterium]
MPRRIATIIASSVLLLAGLAAPATAGTPTRPPFPVAEAQALQAALDAHSAAGMPGVFAEVRVGHRTWRGAAGVADLETGAPIRPDFQHRVGSITKTFVAAALLQLVGERRIRLDAPVREYLPDLATGDHHSRVTVRMLLNHTSGIEDYFAGILRSEADLERYRTESISPRRLAEAGLALPPTNAPGERFDYSNTNYILAGLIIEAVTRRPATDEITRRVIDRLHLRDTYFPGDNPRIVGPHSRAYIPWTDGEMRDFSVYNQSIFWTAGALVSTMRDLNRFYDALLFGRLLRRDLLAQMMTTVPMNPADLTEGRYGLGIYAADLPCGVAWGHDGRVWGQLTTSMHRADRARQVSLAENMSHYAGQGVVTPIEPARRAFLGTALCGPAAGPAAPTTLAATPLRLPRVDDGLPVPR